jgi:1,4-alpha-glucan branching enzyme
VDDGGVYKVVLDTDRKDFGGKGRICKKVEHFTFAEGYAGRKNHMCLYIPSRTAQVLAKIK